MNGTRNKMVRTHKVSQKCPAKSSSVLSHSLSSFICVLLNILASVCACVCVFMCPWRGPLLSLPRMHPLLRHFLHLSSKLNVLHFVFLVSLPPFLSLYYFFPPYLTGLLHSLLPPLSILISLLLVPFILYTPHPVFSSDQTFPRSIYPFDSHQSCARSLRSHFSKLHPPPPPSLYQDSSQGTCVCVCVCGKHLT